VEGPVEVEVGYLGTWRKQLAAFTYFDEPVTIESIAPARGPTSGGYQVVITGTSFAKRPSVTIGGAACTEIAYLSQTQLTCTTPAGEIGEADVVLTVPNQEPSVLEGGYQYYQAFTVTKITSTWGMAAGGEEVVIAGSNFDSQTEYLVTLGGSACTEVTVASDGTSLTCTTGACSITEGLTEEVVDVVVTDEIITETLTDAFEYIGEIYLRLSLGSEKISFHLSPHPKGAVTSIAKSVTVSTNSHAGYQLSLSAAETETSLIGNTSTQKITASAGTVTTPIVLARRTWGFAWASGGGSGSGYAGSGFDSAYTPETTTVNSTSKWAGLTPAGSPTLIRTRTDQYKNGDDTEIFFGVNADFTLPQDTYSQTILFTVIEN
jgi:hypothetical protein